MVNQVEIDIPAVIDQFLSDSDVVHHFAVGALEEVHRVEHLIMAEVATIEQVERHQAALPFAAKAIA